MGISLNGLTPAGTYQGLIKTGDNTAISGTPKVLSDGNGNNLPMEVSTTEVNFTNQLKQGGVAVPTASQVSAKQDTLVSGTNIKTINGTSLLGSGNIPVVTSPSGVSGAIQFSNGSAFASDAANLFWDDTNNRLGIGTNAPSNPFEIYHTTNYGVAYIKAATALASIGNGSGWRVLNAAGNSSVWLQNTNASVGIVSSDSALAIGAGSTEAIRITTNTNVNVNATTDLGAKLGIKGSGSTSATTSLLVQNSAGAQLFKIADDGAITMGANNIFGRFYTNVAGAAFPAYSFNGNSQTGMFDLGAGGIGFGSSNTERMRVGDSGVGVNTLAANNASAQFQIDSTTRGFLPPRLTTTQKNAIASPAAGLVLYDSTTNKLQCYNGSTWNDLF
jgi:hypothetical protein